MANRPGFWQPAKSEDNRVQRNESTVSRQFQPKKMKEGTQEWMQVDKPEPMQQHFGYTPFKTGGSVASRGSTPVPPTNNNKPHTGTLRPAKVNPFEYNSVFGKDLPNSQSTPKVQHSPARPESAVPPIPRAERSRTWGRGPHMPPGTLRSASAMGHPHPHPQTMTIGRPGSRISEAGIHNGMPIGSRYQSYTTLPRPEQVDPMSLEEMGYYGDTYGPPRPMPPKMIISRPPSAVPSVIPGMASDFVHPNGGFMVPPPIQVQPNISQETDALVPRYFIGWTVLKTLCLLQLLFGFGIFTVGVLRMTRHAKWAIGVELAFAISVLLSGSIGYYAARKKSYCPAAAAYSLAGANCILAIVPFILGLFPTIPWSFSSVEADWFVSKNEPIEMDLGLSLVIAAEVLVSVIMCLSGCAALGKMCLQVNLLKAKAEMADAYEQKLPSKH